MRKRIKKLYMGGKNKKTVGKTVKKKETKKETQTNRNGRRKESCTEIRKKW